jgi:hypothetical protein
MKGFIAWKRHTKVKIRVQRHNNRLEIAQQHYNSALLQKVFDALLHSMRPSPAASGPASLESIVEYQSTIHFIQNTEED